jgi:dihydropteroate synthase
MASTTVPYVVMHWRGFADRMEQLAQYDDVVADVRRELAVRVESLVAGGIDRTRLVLDPGLGFAKRGEHNWALLARLQELQELGLPVLVGASRKRFLGTLLAGPDGQPRPPVERDAATAATSALAAAAGAWCVRVHDVPPTADAVRVVAATAAAARPASLPASEVLG